MKKNWLNILISIMTVSLIGVIVLQAYWINNAIQVEAKQFDNLVSDVMESTVRKVELSEEAYFTAEFISTGREGSEPMVFHDKDGRLTWKMEVDTFIDSKHPKRVHKEMKIEMKMDDEDKADKKWIYKSIRSKEGEIIQENLIEDHDVIIVDERSENVFISKDSARVEMKLKKMNEVMRKMVQDIQDTSASISARLQDIPVERILETELHNRGLKVQFKCAVVDREKNEVYPLSEDGFDETMLGNSYNAQLFPSDIFVRPHELLVFFPGKLAYVWGSQWLMLLLSLLFTLIVIFAFFASVRQMLRQKKLSEMKNDFINNITHEFKTPLATISLAVDSLQQDAVRQNTSKVDYFRNIIKEENERLNSHVENILQLAVLDKGEYQLNKEEVDLHELLEDSIAKMDLQLKQSNSKVEWSLNAGKSIINADRNYLSSVFTNLIDNAIKYKSENDPHIVISSENPDTISIALSVTDNGIGMDKETSARIFEDFYRKSTGNVHNVKGFGIGLSFVKGAVLAHGGTVNVISEAGKGSTFRITFDQSIT